MTDTTTTEIEFQKFAKIPRLYRACCVTEKIDRSNAQIVIPEDDGPMLVGSRNRWITPGKRTDNFGFADWAYQNEASLRRLGPGRHYGEWWGAGIGRRYGLATRRWSLFNVLRWKQCLPDPLPELGVALVPIIYQGEFDTLNIAAACKLLQSGGSMAEPGFMQPEGIVVKHFASGQLFKFTFNGDAKDAPSPEE